MGGDAVHLFAPTGGMGYNTAVDDAANVGWKLAAAVRGQGGRNLIANYEAERKPVGLRFNLPIRSGSIVSRPPSRNRAKQAKQHAARRLSRQARKQ